MTLVVVPWQMNRQPEGEHGDGPAEPKREQRMTKSAQQRAYEAMRWAIVLLLFVAVWPACSNGGSDQDKDLVATDADTSGLDLAGDQLQDTGDVWIPDGSGDQSPTDIDAGKQDTQQPVTPEHIL